jgi:hypothetical protein
VLAVEVHRPVEGADHVAVAGRVERDVERAHRLVHRPGAGRRVAEVHRRQLLRLQRQAGGVVHRGEVAQRAAGGGQLVRGELAGARRGAEHAERVARGRLEPVEQLDTRRAVERGGAGDAQPVELRHVRVAPGQFQ